MKSITAGFLMVGLLASTAAWADKELIYVEFAGSCPQYTMTDEANCEGAPHERDKSCRKTGEKVRWESTDRSAFAIEFEGANPMDARCSLTSNNNGKVPPCAVVVAATNPPTEYKYSVVTPACSLDPRIIVR